MLSERYSDGELVSACIEGQSWAWEELVERYKRLVYSVSLRAGLTEEDAADVFQTVFTLLFEHLHRIRTPEGLPAWFITTAKRESWRRLRAAEEWLLNAHPNEDLWIDQTLVRNALEEVGGRCKELLWLLYYDPHEPSYKEISRRIRIPLGSVGPTRARCLQKLRGILKSMGMSEM